MNQKNLIISALGCLALLFACDKAEETPSDFWENHEAFQMEYDIPSGISPSDLFLPVGENRGEVDLEEASGLVISLANPSHLWTHEDKSNDNSIFLIDQVNGEIVAEYKINGTRNRDWEDIEIGSGPEEGINYIYIGEIGDNDRVYTSYSIYRFEEPIFEESHRGKVLIISPEVDEIRFNYAEREKHDAETLLLDPYTKDLFLVTKRSFFSTVYVLPYPQSTTERMEAIKVMEFPFTRAVGGNISLDGREMLIKTYDHIMHWKREPNESMVDMLSKIPSLAPYNPREPQGEAICFDQAKGYYTLSERSNSIEPVLYHYARK